MYQLAEKQVQDVISPYLFHFEEEDIEKFITLFEKLAFIMQDPGTGGSNE